MQKTLKSQSNDYTGTTKVEEYGAILILDDSKDIFTSDNLGDTIGAPISLKADTYNTVLTDKTVGANDRLMLDVKGIFTADKNAEVYVYGEDITKDHPVSADWVNMISRLEKYHKFNQNIVLVSSVATADIKAIAAVINTKRKISIFETAESASADVKKLRTDLNSKNGLIATGGAMTYSQAGLLAGFLGRYFPGASVPSSIKFDGLTENLFNQTDEDTLLGTSEGAIDSTGSGGLMMACLAEGEVKMLWGTATNGKDISTEYFKNWLDDNIELIGGRYISKVNSAGGALRGNKGANELASVITNQVLDRAVKKGALTGDANGNALGITYTSEAGTDEMTTFEVTINGRVAEIVYNLLRQDAIVAGKVDVNLNGGAV